MSNTSRINGFRPVKYLNGAAWNGAANVYFVPASDATAIFPGDLVKLAGDARAATGAPTVTRVSTAATDVPVGVVIGVLFTGVGDVTNMPPVNDLNTPIYRRASTDRYLLVVDDPQVLFEVEYATQGASAATITGNVGANGQPVLGAGSTLTGQSGMTLSATTGTAATLPLKIVGYPNRPDNIPGDPFFTYFVKMNSSQLSTGTGSVGV